MPKQIRKLDQSDVNARIRGSGISIRVVMKRPSHAHRMGSRDIGLNAPSECDGEIEIIGGVHGDIVRSHHKSPVHIEVRLNAMVGENIEPETEGSEPRGVVPLARVGLRNHDIPGLDKASGVNHIHHPLRRRRK